MDIKMKKTIFGLAILTILFSVCNSFAQNPIIQTNYTADPAPMVHNGIVYLYTSHDEDITVKNFFTMNDWRCYSSKDMVNWTDHGSVLSYKAFSWSRGDAWAGQCIYRSGKFYYYLPVNQKNGGNAIGVAISDNPTGNFKDAIGVPLLSGFGFIDPSVFIDEDGQAYLYWGNPELYYVKLNEDMLSYDKETGVVKVPLTNEGFSTRIKDAVKRPSAYEEGPWFFKRNHKYYLLYPAGGVPEHLAYSTSIGPTGP
ncbi:MAG: carbohydrate-binding protein, partial [Chryseobacterium sp.]